MKLATEQKSPSGLRITGCGFGAREAGVPLVVGITQKDLTQLLAVIASRAPAAAVRRSGASRVVAAVAGGVMTAATEMGRRRDHLARS